MPTSDDRQGGGAIRRAAPYDDVAEINHRIANSLQLVATFLSLQQREVADAAAKQVLKAASTRVAAICKVQRALMQSGGGSVDLLSFVGALCADVQTLTGLRISAQIDDVALDPARAQHLGVAINELLINAAKHAYGEHGGEVVVTCKRSPRGFLLVTVTDQGQGLPGDLDRETDVSIGMTILRSAARQLQGELTFRSGRGVTAKLKFPMQRTSSQA